MSCKSTGSLSNILVINSIMIHHIDSAVSRCENVFRNEKMKTSKKGKSRFFLRVNKYPFLICLCLCTHIRYVLQALCTVHLYKQNIFSKMLLFCTCSSLVHETRLKVFLYLITMYLFSTNPFEIKSV